LGLGEFDDRQKLTLEVLVQAHEKADEREDTLGAYLLSHQSRRK
jgi:hypothetical protein